MTVLRDHATALPDGAGSRAAYDRLRHVLDRHYDEISPCAGMQAIIGKAQCLGTALGHYGPDAHSDCYRAGSAPSYVMTEAGREAMQRPRVRRVRPEAGSEEVILKSWKLAQSPEEWEAATMRAVLCGVSTRDVPALRASELAGQSRSTISRLLSTNSIENVFKNLRRHIGKVCRWRESTDQADRRLASGMPLASKGFRRIAGHERLPELVRALGRKLEIEQDFVDNNQTLAA